MKQKLQTLFITLLICLLGGVNLSPANAAGVSIPQELDSYINLKDAASSSNLELTKCEVLSSDDKVIDNTRSNTVISLKLNNTTAGNYVLSFVSGTKGFKAEVVVEVTGDNYKMSRDFAVAATSNWELKNLHYMALDNLPVGELTMKLSVKSTEHNTYAGRFGNFSITKPSDYDKISDINLAKGEYVGAKYESDARGVGYCSNGSTATYMAYNPVSGDATLNIGLEYNKGGTITVTVTDINSETAELTKDLVITKDICKGLNNLTPFPLGKLTEGLKTIKFTMATEGSYICNYHNVGVSVVPQFDVEVGSTGFATIGFPYATTLPASVTGYAVTGVTNTAVTLTEVPSGTNIAANTGLIIVAKQGSYTFPVVESGTEIENNNLVANTEGVKTATTEGEFYVLAVTNEQAKTVGLAKIAQNGTLAKNRAYMPASVIPASVSAQPATFRLVFGDATMVTEVGDGNAEAVETVVYNLAGQRVNDNAKGLVVVKGRVYLKK